LHCCGKMIISRSLTIYFKVVSISVLTPFTPHISKRGTLLLARSFQRSLVGFLLTQTFVRSLGDEVCLNQSISYVILLVEIMIILHLGDLRLVILKVEKKNYGFTGFIKKSSKIDCLQLHHYTVDLDRLIEICQCIIFTCFLDPFLKTKYKICWIHYYGSRLFD